MTEGQQDTHYNFQELNDFENNKISEINNECKYYTKICLDETHHFLVLHMNVRSMKNKMDDIENFLSRLDISWDVICISETWLKDDIAHLFEIEKYNCLASCRQIGEGGGTAIYVHERHEVVERRDLESTEIETTFLQLKVNKGITRNIIIGVIYRPPTFSNFEFLTYMEKVLDLIENEKKVAIITGDFNYDLLPMHENGKTNDFGILMQSYGFYPTITKATRKQKQVSSLLDNIFVNNLQLYRLSGVIVEDLSDHFPIFASLNLVIINGVEKST